MGAGDSLAARESSISYRAVKKRFQVSRGAALATQCNARWRPGSDDAATLVASSRSHVDHPVAGCDHPHFMLDHDHRVA